MGKVKTLAALTISALVCGAVIMPGGAAAQVATTIASGAATSLVVDQLMTGLDQTIQNAQDAGDYVTAMAAARAKDVLAEWRRVNSDLLDKAFGELDSKSHELFGRTRTLIADFTDPLKDRLQTAQTLVNTVNQIAQSLPVPGGKQVYVVGYSPRVAPPNEQTAITVRLSGVNLDKGDPQLKLAGKAFERILPGPLEVSYALPIDALAGDRAKVSVVTLDLEYSTPKEGVWAWVTGGREHVKRQLSIVVLPESVARYKLEGVQVHTRRETEIYTRNLAKYEGTNTTKRQAASPQPGWLWDLSQPFQVLQGRGKSASCQPPDLNNASPNGVPVPASLNKIWDSTYPTGHPGWVHCSLRGTVFRDVAYEAAIPVQTGELKWTKDESLDLPANLKSFKLSLTTFDKRERTFNSTDADKFFNVRKSPSSIVLTPKVPGDLQ
jgi:hypothetical protein